jgi:hypothetical protein
MDAGIANIVAWVEAAAGGSDVRESLRLAMVKSGVTAELRPRLSAQMLTECDAAPVVESLRLGVTPDQFAGAASMVLGMLKSRVAKRAKGVPLCFVHCGVSSPEFMWLNELVQHVGNQGVRTSLLAATPHTLAVLAYSRVRRFRATQLTAAVDATAAALEHLPAPDVVCIQPTGDDVASLLALIDMFVSRRAIVVLLGVADPGFPNTAKVWQMCTQTEKLGTATFDERCEGALVTGGGIGVAWIA